FKRSSCRHHLEAHFVPGCSWNDYFHTDLRPAEQAQFVNFHDYNLEFPGEQNGGPPVEVAGREIDDGGHSTLRRSSPSRWRGPNEDDDDDRRSCTSSPTTAAVTAFQRRKRYQLLATVFNLDFAQQVKGYRRFFSQFHSGGGAGEVDGSCRPHDLELEIKTVQNASDAPVDFTVFSVIQNNDVTNANTFDSSGDGAPEQPEELATLEHEYDSESLAGPTSSDEAGEGRMGTTPRTEEELVPLRSTEDVGGPAVLATEGSLSPGLQTTSQEELQLMKGGQSNYINYKGRPAVESSRRERKSPILRHLIALVFGGSRRKRAQESRRRLHGEMKMNKALADTPAATSSGLDVENVDNDTKLKQLSTFEIKNSTTSSCKNDAPAEEMPSRPPSIVKKKDENNDHDDELQVEQERMMKTQMQFEEIGVNGRTRLMRLLKKEQTSLYEKLLMRAFYTCAGNYEGGPGGGRHHQHGGAQSA
ncbi:unnamed protein product, partial [Amoebophrya sp. A120]